MLRSYLILFVSLILLTPAIAQNDNPIKVISREVEGEVRTFQNDTLYGKIKVREAQDNYVTSILFIEAGHKKRVISAFDIKKFRQIVPFPDRAAFGVDEVYYESRPSPDDPYKKVFMPLAEWK